MLIGSAGGYGTEDTSTLTDRLGTAVAGYPYGTDVGSVTAGNDQPDFATYTKDGTTGFEYANHRYYSAGMGRFLSVDPDANSGNVGEPLLFNRYSYSSDDPINESDPSGYCAVVLAGSGQNPAQGSPITQEAETLGADSAYGYDNLTFMASYLSVIGNGTTGSNDATLATLASIRYALTTNSGLIDIVAYSAGASSFTSAFSKLTSAEQARIGLVLYLSPGVNGQIAVNEGLTTVVEGSTFSADPLAMIGTIIPTSLYTSDSVHDTGCAHTDLTCLLASNSAQQILGAMKKNGPCSGPSTFLRDNQKGFRGYFNNGGGGKLHMRVVDSGSSGAYDPFWVLSNVVAPSLEP